MHSALPKRTCFACQNISFLVHLDLIRIADLRAVGNLYRLASQLQELGFPAMPQLELTVVDFPAREGDSADESANAVAELADGWAYALDLQKAREEQQLLEQISPPQTGTTYSNPFATPSSEGGSGGSVSAETLQASSSQGEERGEPEGVIDVESEAAALAQPWGRRLAEWSESIGVDAAGGFFVAKPAAVGRGGGRLGANVIMARGLPAIALAAQTLLLQVPACAPACSHVLRLLGRYLSAACLSLCLILQVSTFACTYCSPYPPIWL